MTSSSSLPVASGSYARSVVVRALSVPIRLYQSARAGRPSPCRYWPTCSTYALEALEAHGAVRGLWLTAGRLLRCHPWASRSGVDLVPERALATSGDHPAHPVQPAQVAS